MNRRKFITHTAGTTGLLGSGIFREAFSQTADPVIETAYGKVKGRTVNKVLAFRGIPYGASTAGAGRFLPPQKPKVWTGVKDALDLGPRAPQPMPGIEPPEVLATDRMEKQGEDCLVLNVWSNGTTGKRPVMVWLHGGGFAAGSAGFSIYDGANLARKRDVVVVGVNHRLNAFGYLYLADLAGSQYGQASNVGQLDIVLALQWVRDNIARFGGDPGNVTIFGQSGGGGKVSTLLAMPAAKGLFHRAIVQSGASLRGIEKADATKMAEAFLAKLNLKPNQVDQLAKLPTAQIVDATRGPFNWGPVVDSKTLPAHPFDPAAPGVSADVPLLIGCTETEMPFFTSSPMFQYSLDDLSAAALTQNLKKFLRADDADTGKVIAIYKKSFPQTSNIDIFLKATSDVGVRSMVLTEAERKAALNRAPVFLYFFDWRSPVRQGKMKSYHTLEIPFVFENVDEAKSMTGEGKDRYPLQDKMSAAWTSFARAGNPNTKEIPNWPAFTAAQRATMILGNACKVANDPHKAERLVLAGIKRAPGGPF